MPSPFLSLSLYTLLLITSAHTVHSKCSQGCETALASYYVTRDQNLNLTYISQLFYGSTDVQSGINRIISYNPETITSQDSFEADTRINIPFSCDCFNHEFLGHMVKYEVQTSDTYLKVASDRYANLTDVEWLKKFNSYDENRIPDTGFLNVTVNCSCGNDKVSKDYGLFVTWPLRKEDSLERVAASTNVTEDVLKGYNPGKNFSSGAGLVFVPGKDPSGKYPPLQLSTELSIGAIAGISIAAIAGALFIVGYAFIWVSRRKRVKLASLGYDNDSDQHGTPNLLNRTTELGYHVAGASPALTGITVDKSVEFSYEELAKATDDFNMSHKIGEGGFGVVYYAELRGEKAAIKKMDLQASKEFLAELKVLTHVHHLNLVRLIGYCVEGSLFLVYEFIENGNLSQYLHALDREPLSWATRVQIALDSARGLEYIHEHTVPVYIHRDIKSANILIDKNLHGKVADFGLTKLTEVGSASLQTRLVGTFGYMPPEYRKNPPSIFPYLYMHYLLLFVSGKRNNAMDSLHIVNIEIPQNLWILTNLPYRYAQYGDVSPKVDVYAFGVVIYELISAKEAVVKTNGNVAESRGLVALFDDVLNQPDPSDDLRKVIDPRLGDNYPLDSVRKMAQLAKACTQENPQLRPSMRSIVVALMTLSSTTEDWDVGSFYENQALMNLMSGK